MRSRFVSETGSFLHVISCLLSFLGGMALYAFTHLPKKRKRENDPPGKRCKLNAPSEDTDSTFSLAPTDAETITDTEDAPINRW